MGAVGFASGSIRCLVNAVEPSSGSRVLERVLARRGRIAAGFDWVRRHDPDDASKSFAGPAGRRVHG